MKPWEQDWGTTPEEKKKPWEMEWGTPVATLPEPPQKVSPQPPQDPTYLTGLTGFVDTSTPTEQKSPIAMGIKKGVDYFTDPGVHPSRPGKNRIEILGEWGEKFGKWALSEADAAVSLVNPLVGIDYTAEAYKKSKKLNDEWAEVDAVASEAYTTPLGPPVETARTATMLYLMGRLGWKGFKDVRKWWQIRSAKITPPIEPGSSAARNADLEFARYLNEQYKSGKITLREATKRAASVRMTGAFRRHLDPKDKAEFKNIIREVFVKGKAPSASTVESRVQNVQKLIASESAKPPVAVQKAPKKLPTKPVGEVGKLVTKHTEFFNKIKQFADLSSGAPVAETVAGIHNNPYFQDLSKKINEAEKQLDYGKSIELHNEGIAKIDKMLNEPPTQELLKLITKPPQKVSIPPPVGGEIIEPVKEAPLPRETGLSKKEISRIRGVLRLDQLEKPLRESQITVMNEAIERGLHHKAMDIALSTLKNNSPVDRWDYMAMQYKQGELLNEVDALTDKINELTDAGKVPQANHARGRREAALDQIDTLHRASTLGKGQTARNLSIYQRVLDRESMRLADVRRELSSALGRKLTAFEVGEVEILTNNYRELEKELNKLKKSHQALLEQQEKSGARETVKRETGLGTPDAKRKAKILKDRKAIKAQLEGLGMQMNEVTGLGPQVVYLIGRLAVSYVREGVTSLPEVAKKVIADIPDLTETDVYQALNARNPASKLNTARRDVERQVRSIKTQARLTLELRELEKGIVPEKKPAKPREVAPEVKTLQKKITELRRNIYQTGAPARKLKKALDTMDELQDMLANQWRKIKKKMPIVPEDLKAIREKSFRLRKQIKMDDEIANLKHQIETGEYDIPIKPTQREYPPDIMRKQVELAKLRKRVKALIEHAKPRTLGQKIGGIPGFMRTLKATFDWSATLRQGLITGVSHPGLGVKTFAKSAGAFFSNNSAEKVDFAIRNNPRQYIADMSGLELTEFGDVPLTEKEEFFLDNYAEHIPGYGRVVQASDRHMVTTLNLLRVGHFFDFLDKYPNATPDELKAWADWVNIATGRGPLGKFTQAAKNLSWFIFSPRFSTSRILTPFQVFRRWKQPRVRKEIAKDQAKLIGFLVGALALAGATGADVEWDPDSPDFLKIKVGNTRFDILGGIQQPVRLMMRMFIAGGRGLQGEAKWGQEPLDLLWRFARYKAAPGVNIPLELISGKTAVGEPRKWYETLYRAPLPLSVEAGMEAYMLDGAEVGIAAYTGEWMGLGVSSYKKD